MLRRNLSSVFVAGAHVFPGGAVDDDDRGPAAQALVTGVDAASASRGSGATTAVSASGSRRSGSPSRRPVSCSRATPRPGLPWRARRRGPRRARAAGRGRRSSFSAIVPTPGSCSTPDACGCSGTGSHRPAHRAGTTPGSSSRRRPPATPTSHDEDETIASEWVRPADALEQAARKDLDLIYPTYRSSRRCPGSTRPRRCSRPLDDAWQDAPGALAEVVGERAWQVRLPGDGDDESRAGADRCAHSTTPVGRSRQGAPRRGTS